MPANGPTVDGGTNFEYGVFNSDDSDQMREVVHTAPFQWELGPWTDVDDWTQIDGLIESCWEGQWQWHLINFNPEHRNFQGTAQEVPEDTTFTDGFTFDDVADLGNWQNRPNVGSRDDPAVGVLTVDVTVQCPWGAIAGVVRTPEQEPIEGATVTLWLNGELVMQDTSGLGGTYLFAQLMPGGGYTAQCRMDGHTPDPAASGLLTVVRAQQTECNFELTPEPMEPPEDPPPQDPPPEDPPPGEPPPEDPPEEPPEDPPAEP